jgi:hypothetical protein
MTSALGDLHGRPELYTVAHAASPLCTQRTHHLDAAQIRDVYVVAHPVPHFVPQMAT